MYVEKEIVPEPGSKRAQLADYFSAQAMAATGRIEQFIADMQASPVRAMEWADKIFEATASKDVADMMLYMLKHYSDLDDIKKSVQGSMRDKARYINNKSTSTCSNFLKECLLAQTVAALEYLEHFA